MSAADGRQGAGTAGARGIREAARRVVSHASSLVRLEQELARSELGRKGRNLGAGAGVGVAAAVLALYAVGFGFAAAAVALALVVDWWLALLIVFGVLLLLVIVLGLVALRLFRSGAVLKPEQAIEEARATKQVLRGGAGDG